MIDVIWFFFSPFDFSIFFLYFFKRVQLVVSRFLNQRLLFYPEMTPCYFPRIFPRWQQGLHPRIILEAHLAKFRMIKVFWI